MICFVIIFQSLPLKCICLERRDYASLWTCCTPSYHHSGLHKENLSIPICWMNSTDWKLETHIKDQGLISLGQRFYLTVYFHCLSCYWERLNNSKIDDAVSLLENAYIVLVAVRLGFESFLFCLSWVIEILSYSVTSYSVTSFIQNTSYSGTSFFAFLK